MEKFEALEVDFGVSVISDHRIERWSASVNESSQHVIDQVIARITRERCLMTACHDGTRAGVLVESVQWLMTEPLLIGVSVRKGHEIDPLIRDARSFAIGFIDQGDSFITRRFGQRLNGIDSAIHVPGLDPFDTLKSSVMVTGSPLLPQCSTWVDCEVLRRVDLENAYEFFVGSVVGLSQNGESVRIERTEFVEDES